ncbi:MAG: hypothetical protein HAW64_04635 [Alphaproteobacteria bacterium]|nr:hypothetical protein [Alphaproteobacteria bacterium]
MSIDESFYVAVSFATIIALFIYLRIPQRILQALDDKTDEIKKELEAAQHLREEAQALLKTYQAQGKQAEKQAAELIANARAAAERQANEATQVMERQIEQRTKQAEERIVRSQEELSKEVRAAITTLAIEAGRELIAQGVSAKEAEDIIEKNIAEISSRL